MKLFILGIGHTMGRAQAAQHRTFLELCAREGWLDVFAAPAPRPDDWMRVIDGYLDAATGDVEWFHWMRQFVAVY